MKAIDFNDGWSWRHLGDESESAWTPVTVPHDAMLTEPRHPDAPGGSNTGWFEGRDYEYVRRFTPGEELRGRTAVVEFDGVYKDAEVWLGGERLAYRPNGYTTFAVDVTDHLAIGEENTLRVVARNSDQPNSRWYSGAGIYRPVTLWVGDPVHIPIDGIVVRTLSIEPPTVEVTVTTTQPGAVAVRLESLDGAHVLHASSAPGDGVVRVVAELPGARLWSPASPALYRCVAEVAAGESSDRAETLFGIRTIEWGADGFLINGERTILQGACIHHDNGVLGARAFRDAEERKVRLLRENGYNAVRSAHNPCSKALLDACDRLGMLVVDEYIDHWYIHKTRHDYARHFDQWWEQDLRDMVVKDRNHPSVVMYSIGNEVGETSQERGIELTRRMTAHLHDLDPTRPVTCGINIFFNFLTSIGMGVYSDKKAEREVAKSTRRKRAVGSEFFNNMAGLLGADFMKWGATLRGSDVKTRDAFAELDIAGYNYGIRRYERDIERYPERLILGTETFCADAYRFRELAKAHPRIIGDFVWAGMDYLGETAIGAWEYRDYAPEFRGFGWLTAGSGRIDVTGKPLGEALYTRVALEQERGPLIAVRPVEYSGEKHSPSAWKMSNAIDSWAWEGCEGRRAEVEVYVRAARVDLLLDGRVVDRAVLKNDCIARLSCRWEPGTLEAVAFDESGVEVGRSALRSAAESTELRAEPEAAEVAAGGLAFVRLRYTDPDGIGKPRRRGILRVTVEGGTLVGLGSAAPYNPRGYTAAETDTYYGEALAVVQAGPSGTVALTVDDGELHGRANVEIVGVVERATGAR